MNRRFYPFAWLIFLFAWGSLGCGRLCASSIIDTIDPQQYRDEALLYPSVAKVTGSVFSGSGVVISDRWILTAGHVAFNKTGGIVTVGGNSYTVQSTIIHPSYSFLANPFDIGLLYLSSAVIGVSPATLLKLDEPASILGREATWVGHGLAGTGSSGQTGPVDFRGFTNVIDVFGPNYGLTSTAFISDFDNPDGSTNASGSSPAATRLEGNVTSGDSGGGVFVTVDGERYLVGISSFTGGFVQGSNSKYGSISGATDLQQFHSWIQENTGVVAIPEPRLYWFSMGAVLVGCLLRRRCDCCLVSGSDLSQTRIASHPSFRDVRQRA